MTLHYVSPQMLARPHRHDSMMLWMGRRCVNKSMLIIKALYSLTMFVFDGSHARL